MLRAVGLGLLVLLLVLWVIQAHCSLADPPVEPEAAVVPRGASRVRLAEPLPRRTFRDPLVPEPVRTRAGTLIPLVAHVWEGAAWDAVADAWQKQGWHVRRWPVDPPPTLTLAVWPYFLVWEYGGLCTTEAPAAPRSLKNYLIYTGYDATAVFFRQPDATLSATTLAAQARHPAVWALLTSQSVVRHALHNVRVLEHTVFMSSQ